MHKDMQWVLKMIEELNFSGQLNIVNKSGQKTRLEKVSPEYLKGVMENVNHKFASFYSKHG